LQLICQSHPEELLTNFCSHPACIKPLCPNCIETHNKFHKLTNTFEKLLVDVEYSMQNIA